MHLIYGQTLVSIASPNVRIPCGRFSEQDLGLLRMIVCIRRYIALLFDEALKEPLKGSVMY